MLSYHNVELSQPVGFSSVLLVSLLHLIIDDHLAYIWVQLLLESSWSYLLVCDSSIHEFPLYILCIPVIVCFLTITCTLA